jgi:drug/metabolite transporter (DMT)-like permease
MSPLHRGYALVFVGGASYGLVSALVKRAYDAGFGAAQVATSQAILGFSAMSLGLVIGHVFGRRVRLPSLREVAPTLGIGATTGVTAFLYYGALERIDASIAIVLLFQFTWMGLVCEAILRREWPRPSSIVALLAALAGTLLAAGVFDARANTFDALGYALGLGSGISYTAFVVGSSRTGASIDPYLRSAFMALAASVVLAVLFRPSFASPGTSGLGLLPWALGLGFFGVIVPNVTFAIGAPEIGGERASLVAAVELPVAVLVAHSWLGEHVTPLAWAGVLLILVAVAVPVLGAPTGEA